MLAIKERVKLTEESGLMPEIKEGTIVEVDENDEMMPYKVRFDGEVIGIWVFKDEIELIKEEKE
jgi:hypothetical protein